MPNKQKSDRKTWLLLFVILCFPLAIVEWAIINYFTPIGDLNALANMIIALGQEKDPWKIIWIVIEILIPIFIAAYITEKIEDKFGLN